MMGPRDLTPALTIAGGGVGIILAAGVATAGAPLAGAIALALILGGIAYVSVWLALRFGPPIPPQPRKRVWFVVALTWVIAALAVVVALLAE